MPMVMEQPNITPSVLDRLVDDEPHVGTPFIYGADLKSPVSFLKRLRIGEDALSRYLVQQLPSDIRTSLLEHNGKESASDDFLNAVIDGLNQVIRKQCIYDHERFNGVKLSREARQSVESVVQGANVPFVNRTLLEEAYPDEIRKRRRDATGYTIRQMKEHVARDLGALLNTRRELLTDMPEEYTELKGAILEYGLPDFTSFSLVNINHQKKIRRDVEQAIAAFEPRLKSVRVSLDLPKQYDQTLHFRIHALLRLDPTPEPVSFDAVLQLATCEYSVRS